MAVRWYAIVDGCKVLKTVVVALLHVVDGVCPCIAAHMAYALVAFEDDKATGCPVRGEAVFS